MKLSNSGAAVARADGVAEVLVRGGLARSTDERIKVELDGAPQKPVDDARARRDREEQGIVTWSIAVRRGVEARVGWRVVTGHLDGAELVETQRR